MGLYDFMSRKLKMTMTLPCIADIETVAHAGLERLCTEGNIQLDKVEEAKMLVNEAIINAIEHAQTKRNQIKIEFDLSDDHLLIFVRDYGHGFDVSLVDDPNIDEKIGGDYKRGWGIKLMQTLSDDFKIESGKGGTKIYMYLHLNQA
jgi:anti-sigma regulatory factor (Ser/Thr protein kinase)